MLTTEDLVLILTGRAGGRTDFGRTSLQKVVFLLSARLNLGDQGHTAYHYGPYSRSLEVGVASLVAEGLLEERYEELGFHSRGGHPARRYRYSLTDAGSSRLAAIEGAHKGEVAEVDAFLDDLIGVVGGLDQRVLSMAAKTLYLAQREGKELTYPEVGLLARQLGWSLSEPQVDDVARKLRNLGLLSLR